MKERRMLERALACANDRNTIAFKLRRIGEL